MGGVHPESQESQLKRPLATQNHFIIQPPPPQYKKLAGSDFNGISMICQQITGSVRVLFFTTPKKNQAKIQRVLPSALGRSQHFLCRIPSGFNLITRPGLSHLQPVLYCPSLEGTGWGGVSPAHLCPILLPWLPSAGPSGHKRKLVRDAQAEAMQVPH